MANFAGEKINSLRINSGLKDCLNVAVLRTNAMKGLHNYFEKESVSKFDLNEVTNFLAFKNVLLLCRPSFQKIKS